jgi:triosephosphate isomerase
MKHERGKLFGTWKNRLSVAASESMTRALEAHLVEFPTTFEVSVCPPMVAMAPVQRILSGILSLTAQNLVWDDDVSFTGETNATHLLELGCKYVIIGHSERRIYLREDDEIVARKVQTAVHHGLSPVICIGEFYEDYKTGRTKAVIESQLASVIRVLRNTENPQFVIAYEPAWAISTSREALKCEPDLANANHLLIRELIRNEWGHDFAERTTILYGGSVSPQNARDYFLQSDIDGGLVGTASQSLDGFKGLIAAARYAFNPKLEV